MINNRENISISGRVFTVGKKIEKLVEANNEIEQKFHFRLSMLVTVCVITILFLAFQKYEKPVKVNHSTPAVVIELQDIPSTNDPGRPMPKPPSRPFVPVPSDDVVYEDLQIPDWEVDMSLVDLPGVPGRGGYGGSATGRGVVTMVSPRPILEVIPEYNEKEVEKGKSGFVEVFYKIDKKGKVVDVTVLKNTTGSKILENATVEAVFKTRYTPAKRGGKPIEYESTRKFTFNVGS